MASKENCGIKLCEQMVQRNKLTQIGLSFYANKSRRRNAVFRCDCGSHVIRDLNHVKSGGTQSCGCLAESTLLERNTKHGQAITGKHSSTYNAWAAMKRRCKINPYYTSKKIRICDRWKSFEKFREDMGERPDGYTLERIDNNGGYEPNNCRWATLAEQQRNKSNTRFITANGETMCLSQWAVKTGIPRETLKRRLNMGWEADAIINTPVRKR